MREFKGFKYMQINASAHLNICPVFSEIDGVVPRIGFGSPMDF